MSYRPNNQRVKPVGYSFAADVAKLMSAGNYGQSAKRQSCQRAAFDRRWLALSHRDTVPIDTVYRSRDSVLTAAMPNMLAYNDDLKCPL